MIFASARNLCHSERSEESLPPSRSVRRLGGCPLLFATQPLTLPLSEGEYKGTRQAKRDAGGYTPRHTRASGYPDKGKVPRQICKPCTLSLPLPLKPLHSPVAKNLTYLEILFRTPHSSPQ